MNKKILFALPIITCSLASCVGTAHYEPFRYRTSVEWTDSNEKDFNILQLCDIHLGQSDLYEKHFKLMDLTIKDADPDLIVLNGDSFTYADKGLVAKLFSFIDSYNVPWTFAFGNHDDQGYFADNYIQRLLGDNKLFKNVKFVNLEDDDVTGRSNFCIDIWKKDEINGVDKSMFQVFILESHNYNFDTMKYDFIKQNQIDWYERMVLDAKEKNGGVVVPSAMYFHIPLPEFFTAWNELKGKTDNLHNARVPENFDPNASTDEFGGGPLPSSDTHLFDKVKELGSTKAISVAHDHINDSVIIYDEVALCFGVHATDRIYYDAKKLGGQVISINHNDPTQLTFKNIKHSYAEVEGK